MSTYPISIKFNEFELVAFNQDTCFCFAIISCNSSNLVISNILESFAYMSLLRLTF